MQPARILAFSVIAIGLMGLAVLAGFSASHAPSAAAASLLPTATLGAVIIAALVDGFNPCAFTVLLLFLTYLTVGVGLLSVASLLTQRHLPARLGAVLAITLGLWMMKDYFLPELSL